MAVARPTSWPLAARLLIQRLPQRVLIGLVQGYRLFFKAWLGSACRFEPSCSAYALQALQQHGAARGGWLSATRLLRCHPYCRGGCDPVPEVTRKRAAGVFSRLGLDRPDGDRLLSHHCPGSDLAFGPVLDPLRDPCRAPARHPPLFRKIP